MRNIFIALLIFTTAHVFSQSYKMSSLVSERSNTGEIKGVILDGASINEPLAFAEIHVKNTTFTATTDINGVFNFELKPGTYSLIISFLGYETIETEAFVVKSNKEIKLKQFLPVLTVPFDLSSPITVSQN